MEILGLKITENFINLIEQASQADSNKLKLLRKDFIAALDKIGARQFVSVMADILKNKFCLEGCNDARMPLKRIFTIPLEELEEELAKKEYKLAPEHPIVMLSADHKDNIKKLKTLRFSLGGLNLNQETSPEAVKNKLKQVRDYYVQLDLHIRKEEEILFPALEENGMQEHPGNLREEHQGFREILSKIMELFEDCTAEKFESIIEEIRKLKEKFITDISNHIFRESYIFYPAALEFISDRDQWKKIEEGFKAIG